MVALFLLFFLATPPASGGHVAPSDRPGRATVTWQASGRWEMLHCRTQCVRLADGNEGHGSAEVFNVRPGDTFVLNVRQWGYTDSVELGSVGRWTWLRLPGVRKE